MEAGTLAVVCGVPGAGKSTVAQAAADQLDATTLRTDIVRKELFENPSYAAVETDAVYAEVLSRAESRLPDESVVLDGTFRTRARREQAAAVAERVGAQFRLVTVECDRQTVRERIARRENDPSDADVVISEQIREEFEPPARDHVAVDNSGSLADTQRRVAELFR